MYKHRNFSIFSFFYATNILPGAYFLFHEIFMICTTRKTIVKQKNPENRNNLRIEKFKHFNKTLMNKSLILFSEKHGKLQNSRT